MTNATTPNYCEPTEGPLADSELDAVSGGMLYIGKPAEGVADQGISSLISTLVNQLGNKLQVGGASQR